MHDNGKYIGEFANGLRHGIGICSWDGGKSYVGSWENNRQKGHGIYTYSNK